MDKVELLKRLKKLGIKCRGNYIKKADLEKIIASEPTYSIVRFFKNNHPRQIIKKGLSLEEAKEHCSDPEASSATCEEESNIKLTEKMGDWFDGFYEE